jgi:hypothetical protein
VSKSLTLKASETLELERSNKKLDITRETLFPQDIIKGQSHEVYSLRLRNTPLSLWSALPEV